MSSNKWEVKSHLAYCGFKLRLKSIKIDNPVINFLGVLTPKLIFCFPGLRFPYPHQVINFLLGQPLLSLVLADPASRRLAKVTGHKK